VLHFTTIPIEDVGVVNYVVNSMAFFTHQKMLSSMFYKNVATKVILVIVVPHTTIQIITQILHASLTSYQYATYGIIKKQFMFLTAWQRNGRESLSLWDSSSLFSSFHWTVKIRVLAQTQTDQLSVLISTALHDKHISLTDYDDKTQYQFFFFSPTPVHHTNFFWMSHRFPPVAIHC
jgi:hypothetical protein